MHDLNDLAEAIIKRCDRATHLDKRDVMAILAVIAELECDARMTGTRRGLIENSPILLIEEVALACLTEDTNKQ